MSHSGRRFEFERLRLRLDGSLDPTVEFTGLAIENAPWAAPRPLVRARRLAATFGWRSLLRPGEVLVTRLELEGAEVDLERQADGLRNWRLGHPDDRGPPRVRIAALDARDSTLTTVHRGIGLAGEASIAALAPSRVGAGALPLTKRLVFHGDFRGLPFAGEAAVSDVLAFGVDGRRFAFDGAARMDGLRLEGRGTTDDIHALGELDADARLSSDGPGALWPLPLREALARVRPFAASAHVVRTGSAWTFAGLEAALGRGTRLAGELRLRDDPRRAGRRALQATVREGLVEVADLRAMGGPSTGPGAAARALPDDPLVLAKLRGFDGTLALRGLRFAGSERGIAQSLALDAALADGVLELGSLDFGLAGGHLAGRLRLDATGEAARLALSLQARGLRLEQLSARLAATHGLEGRLEGRAELHAQGRSPHALARSAAGRLEFALAPGASVSGRLEAKLGLDGEAWLRALFDGSRRVPLACAALGLDVEHGVATVRRFAFQTARTALAGRGTIDLAEETLDARLMPVRKDAAVLALDRSLHAAGPWQDVRVTLAPPLEDAKPASCPP
jgi:hypothetical protein